MKKQEDILKISRLRVLDHGCDGGYGEVYWAAQKEPMLIIWSFGGGWDHVSCSYTHRVPTWDEMCRVKDMFFNDEETVVQFHPKKSEYKNLCPTCLHLWRKQGQEHELPPRGLV